MATIVEVTVRLTVHGIPDTAEAFAVECVQEALDDSDQIQRCFSDVEVIGSWSKKEDE